MKPHKGVYKIRIYKTHGKRVPMSEYRISVSYSYEDTLSIGYPLVTDLTRVPKKKRISDFTEKELIDIYNYYTIFKSTNKPSLWQRIKRKVRN